METADAQSRRSATGMDETRRFLRQITPGIAFIVQVFVYWFLLDSSGAIKGAREVMKSGGLGGGVALLLASLGIGFLLSTIHHALYSRFPIDYRKMLEGGVDAKLLRFRSPEGHDLRWDRADVQPDLTKEGAWRVVTRLWHQRSQSVQLIRDCVDRNKSLFDFMHGNGAALWGAFLAPLVPAVGLSVVDGCLNCVSEAEAWCLVAIWVPMLLAHLSGYCTTRKHAQSFLEGALLDGLYSNNRAEPFVRCTICPQDRERHKHTGVPDRRDGPADRPAGV